MLPGPAELPTIPSLPFQIHPVLLWGIILLLALAVVITLFRFIFAPAQDRASNFLTFFLVLLGILALYLVTINWDKIVALFR